MSISLRRCPNKIKQEITEEVQEMLDIFDSMENKVENQTQKDKKFQDEIDQLLKTYLSREIRDCVMLSVEKQKNKMLMLEKEKVSNDSKDIQATMKQRIKILENDFKIVEAQYVNLDLKMQHQKEKMACDVSWNSRMTKLSDENLLLKTQVESVVHFTSVANKNDTMNSNVSDSKTNVLKAKTINAVHDGSNLVCVSCGKDVFMISHDKCVARYALSPNSMVIQIVLWIVDSGCSKHMTVNLKLLRNFVEKFMGTVRFGNDNFAAITGYGDYVQGNLTICHMYYVEGLRHNLFSVGEFCDGDLEVAFRSNTCFVRNLEGEDLLTGSHESNLYTISIYEMVASSPIQRNIKAQVLKIQFDNGTEFKNATLKSIYEKLGILHHTSIARTPQQNGVVERKNRTLVEAVRTMPIDDIK
ncbi:integrase, catalytic region, zinc finger, CCHC-type containing protein [Tanacetum coccineum]